MSNRLREELPRILSEQGVSIRELARRIGISDAHLSRVLAARETTSADLARRISHALGLRRVYSGGRAARSRACGCPQPCYSAEPGRQFSQSRARR